MSISSHWLSNGAQLVSIFGLAKRLQQICTRPGRGGGYGLKFWAGSMQAYVVLEVVWTKGYYIWAWVRPDHDGCRGFVSCHPPGWLENVSVSSRGVLFCFFCMHSSLTVCSKMQALIMWPKGHVSKSARLTTCKSSIAGHISCKSTVGSKALSSKARCLKLRKPVPCSAFSAACLTAHAEMPKKPSRDGMSFEHAHVACLMQIQAPHTCFALTEGLSVVHAGKCRLQHFDEHPASGAVQTFMSAHVMLHPV